MQPFGYGHRYGRPAADPLDAVFAALADPTRRAILARLAEGGAGDVSVAELAEPFQLSQPAISKHLKVLEQAGLVSRGRDAQRRPRRLEAAPLAGATEWLEKYRVFWEGRYARLDTVLASLVAAEKRPRRVQNPDGPPSQSPTLTEPEPGDPA